MLDIAPHDVKEHKTAKAIIASEAIFTRCFFIIIHISLLLKKIFSLKKT